MHTQDEVNQEESEQNEVDEMKKGADSCKRVLNLNVSNVRFC